MIVLSHNDQGVLTLIVKKSRKSSIGVAGLEGLVKIGPKLGKK